MSKKKMENFMKKSSVLFIFVFVCLLLFYQCGGKEEGQNRETGVKTMAEQVVPKVISTLMQKCGVEKKPHIEKGVRQVARLWNDTDGSASDFESFCLQNYAQLDEARRKTFKKLSGYYEILNGNLNKITVDLQRTLHLDVGEIHPVDYLFGSYNPGAHLDEDLFRNKIAFITALNFPFYSLEEKKKFGDNWSREEWAYARMGDLYYSRIPAELLQKFSEVNTGADVYISEYNILMGYVLNDKGEKLFPEDMKLLVHWNLRDELKSNYGAQKGLEKQRIIAKVMQRIISQEIPQNVINNKVDWNPFQNKVYKEGKEIEFDPEPDSRYSILLSNFKALKAIDAYCPAGMDTYIKRKFDGEMEISQMEVEELFIKFLSSPQVKEVARLVKKRLNRDLEPFDIWYDGFKARSGIPEEKLNKITRKKYPTAAAMEKDLPDILVKLGFSKEKAEFISSKVAVEPARGSGHAWGSEMRAGKAYLRTRVPAAGMDYKGYNIAVHEFGHNVEQTITLHDVDYYMMRGVPNTAFTEALAFIFQERDLELLGMKENNPEKKYLDTLDTFWSAYEGMGVSLLDMSVWKWLYANPEASPQQLKETVISMAKDIWNKYYAGILGAKDQTLLAIYSHMISYPLYLSAYSYGDLIKFQVQQYVRGKDLAAEVGRMFSQGRLIPQLWMKNAVGEEISLEPLARAAGETLEYFK
jgi:hypothetical protein